MAYQRKIKTSNVKSFEIYNSMKEKLLNGEYFFGEKILVNNLINEFNISRRPIMEGLKELENDGFIEIIPQSGCKVIDYSRQDIIEDLLISSTLEALGAKLAAENRTVEDLKNIEEYQFKMKEILKNNKDRIFYFQYNREFHYLILKMAYSPRIMNRAMKLWDLNDFYLQNVYEEFNLNMEEAIRFHDNILKAIKNGDSKFAKEMMEKHFESYIKKMGESLPTEMSR